jgi:hypothetical protein
MSSCYGTSEAVPSFRPPATTDGAPDPLWKDKIDNHLLSLCVTIDILSIDYLWLTPLDLQETT